MPDWNAKRKALSEGAVLWLIQSIQKERFKFSNSNVIKAIALNIIYIY